MLPPNTYKVDDFETIRQTIFDDALNSLSNRFPLENDKYRLTVEDLGYDSIPKYTTLQQKEAVQSDKTLSAKIKGRWTLYDKNTGKIVSQSSRKTIMDVPYMTERGTFIRNGTEMTLPIQMRLVPGVYARMTDSGEAKAHINVKPGSGSQLSITMNPANPVFKVTQGTRNYKLYPLLKHMGISDEYLMNAWGKDIYKANYDDFISGGGWYSAKTAAEENPYDEITKRVFRGDLDPLETEASLGKGYKTVDPDMMVAAASKLLRISKGEAESDNRDSLENQRFLMAPELIGERVRLDAGKVGQTLLWKISRSGDVNKIPAGALNKYINGLFTESRLAQAIEETNPLDAYMRATKVTRMGEGGISGVDTAPMSARLVHNTYKGFIDPTVSPESLRAGLDSAIALNAVKGKDGFMYTPMINAISGRREYVNSLVASKVPVAFSEYRDSTQKYIPAMVGNKIEYLPKANVKYFIPNGDSLFALSSNLIPLKSGIKAGRLLMAQKHQTQAVSLSSRMAPYVQTEHPGDNTISVEKSIGKLMGAVFSKGDGKVLSVTPDEMTVRYNDGTKETISLYNNYPLNRKSVSGNTSVVILRDGYIKRIKIKDYVFNLGDKVQSVNPYTGRSSWMPISGFEKLPCDKKLYKVTYRSGRSVVVTEDHSLITLDKGKYLVPILPSDVIIGETRSPIAKVERPDSIIQYNKYMATFLGLYLAEGYICPNNRTVCIAVKDPDRSSEVLELINNISPSINAYINGKNVVFTNSDIALECMRVCGRYSDKKFISSDIFNWDIDAIKCFIQGYFAGDGCFHTDRNGVINMCAVSVSAELRDALVDLLSMFNIRSTIFYRKLSEHHDTWNDAYGLRVKNSDINNLEKWFFYSDRNNKLKPYLKDNYRSSWLDNVPLINMTRRDKKELYASIECINPFYYKSINTNKSLSKSRLCNSSIYDFNKWANSDVLWDIIIGIEESPHEEYVYDFCVDTAEAFCVNNGLLVHNTFFNNESRVKPGDIIKKGQVLASSNYTDENGVSALGTQLRTAWMPFKGENYLDAIIVSEDAAKKLSSEHLYHTGVDKDSTTTIDKNAYTSAFPTKFNKDQLATIDKDGIVKPGTTVKFGDPLILSYSKREATPGSLHRALVKDNVVTWEHEFPGYITDVVNSSKGVKVYTKAYLPLQTGDKLAARYANKGVTARVVPTSEMPIAADGKPIDVIFGPTGIVSRVNSAQLVEAMLGKVAAKTGKRYVLPGFMNENMVEFAKRELAQAGLTDREDLTDPTTGITIPQITVGNSYIVKMHHTAESKGGARATGAYTMDELPGGQGHDGSKLLGNLILGAIIGHGSTEVLKDMKLVKGQKNTDFWRDFKLGRTPVMPSTPLIYEKFLASLQGAGINVHKEKNTTNIFALTNKDINDFAHAEVKNSDTYSANNMAPLPGGLFDPNIFGPNGTQWGYIKLDEPVLNPVMEDPIKLILGLTEADLEAVISGNKKLPNGLTGGLGLKKQLESINMKQAVQDALNDVKNATRTKRDKAVKKYRYLSSMLKHNASPADFMLDKIPVIPPRFRRISQSGDLTMVADANYLYRALMDNQQDVRDARNAGLPEDMVGSGNLKIYKAFKAITGLSDPEDRKLQEKQVSGLLKWVFGKGTPKAGAYQRNVVGGSLDVAGRNVITPNASFRLDEIGLPKKEAWTLYQDFVIRRLVQNGMDPLVATKEVTNKTKLAEDALRQVVSERPVLATRAPALHKYSIMAFRPRLVESETLQLNPAIQKPFNADHDGDDQVGRVVIRFTQKIELPFKYTLEF